MRRRHVIHVAGIATAVAALGAWYELSIVRPEAAARDAATRRAEVAERLADVDAALARRDRAAVLVATLREEARTLAVRLLPPSALNRRISEIASLAEREGLRVERIAPGAPVERTSTLAVPLHLGARGGSVAAIRFIAALRSQHPDIAVAGFAVEGRDEDADASVSFDCVWYAERVAGDAAVAAETGSGP